MIWRKQSERQHLNYSYIVIIQLFSMIYCIGSRCRRVAVLNREVSNHAHATPRDISKALSCMVSPMCLTEAGDQVG